MIWHIDGHCIWTHDVFFFLKLLNTMNKCLVLVMIRCRFDSDTFNCKSIMIQNKTIRSDISCFHNDILRSLKIKSIFRCSYYIVTPLAGSHEHMQIMHAPRHMIMVDDILACLYTCIYYCTDCRHWLWRDYTLCVVAGKYC